MPADGRIRICLQKGELEVEGSSAFLAQYEGAINDLLERLAAGGGQTEVRLSESHPPSTAASRATSTREFGELLHVLPNKPTGTDQILVAGWFVQQSSANATFTTGDANKLLLEQGIKVSNPSQSLKNNLAAKRVFKVGSAYRVSKDGEQHLRALIGDL